MYWQLHYILLDSNQVIMEVVPTCDWGEEETQSIAEVRWLLFL